MPANVRVRLSLIYFMQNRSGNERSDRVKVACSLASGCCSGITNYTDIRESKLLALPGLPKGHFVPVFIFFFY